MARHGTLLLRVVYYTATAPVGVEGCIPDLFETLSLATILLLFLVEECSGVQLRIVPLLKMLRLPAAARAVVSLVALLSIITLLINGLLKDLEAFTRILVPLQILLAPTI